MDPTAEKNNDAATAAEETPRRNPAGKIGGLVLLVLILSLVWHVASDLAAPTSKSGAVVARTAQIAPRVAGQVVEILVEDNQRVAAGQPLFRLDPAPFDLTVRQAEAALAQARLAVDASSISLAAAEAQVAQARAGLENTVAATERSRDLFGRGLVTQVQLDGAEAQLVSARATLDAAVAQLDSARLQIGDAARGNPQIMAAEVQLEQALLNRQFATITAPTDGAVTNLRMAVGQFVGAGSPSVTFVESFEPWVTVDLRENQLANVDVGDAARLLFDAVPGRTFEARVRGIAWGIDTGRTAANGLPQNQASSRWFEPARTIPVQIELVDPADWPQNIRVGSMATALVYANGQGGPIARIASGLQRVQSYLSYLY